VRLLAIDINAGSSLIDVVKRAEAAIQLAGQINTTCSEGTFSARWRRASIAWPARWW
jgi:hypothetical protein